VLLLAGVCPLRSPRDDENRRGKVDDEAVNEQVSVTDTPADKPVSQSEVAAHVTIVDREQTQRAVRAISRPADRETASRDRPVGNNVQRSLTCAASPAAKGSRFVDGTRINDPRNNRPLEQVPTVERVEKSEDRRCQWRRRRRRGHAARDAAHRPVSALAHLTRRGLDATYGAQLAGGPVWGRAPTTEMRDFRPNLSNQRPTCRAESTPEWDAGPGSSLLSSSSTTAPGALTLAEFDADPWQNGYNLLDGEHGPATGVADVPGAGRRGFSLAATLATARTTGRRSRPGVRRR
jgi:hypothetical protein